MKKKLNQNISLKPKQDPSSPTRGRSLTEEELQAWREEIKKDQARLKELMNQEGSLMKTPENKSTGSPKESPAEASEEDFQYPESKESWGLEDWVEVESKPPELPSEEILSIRAMLTTKGLKIEPLKTSLDEKDES